MSMLLHGIFPAMTTPFYPDQRVYYKKIEHNVDRYSRTPVTGLVVLGSTGETVLLSEQEQRDVLKASADNCAADKVLIAGVGQESAVETLRLCQYAAELKYDIALVRTPSYYRPQMKPDTLTAYYRYVADRSPLPVLLYSVPPYTAYDLPTEVIAALCEHPNIIGVKESSGNVEKIAAVRERTAHVKRTAEVTEVFSAVTARMKAPQAVEATAAVVPVESLTGSGEVQSGGVIVAAPSKARFKVRQKEVGFQVLCGAAQKMLPSLRAGAAGAVLAFADAAPTACYEVYTAWKEDDQPLATEKQERITRAAQRICGEMGVPGLKHALDLNGYFGGSCRLPLLPLTGHMKAEVEQLMKDIKN
jgi:4-hydroxy-2-oxoglutarate aldolase